MEKAIFIDVDGTLRNDSKEVSERTLVALKSVKELGYEPILCTGRPCDYAEKLNRVVRKLKNVVDIGLNRLSKLV